MLMKEHELTTETMAKQHAVTPCVNDVERSSETKIKKAILKPVQVMDGSKDPVTVCVGVENDVDGRFNERSEVANVLRMHELTRAAGEVENEMNSTENTFGNVGNNDEVVSTMPWLEDRPLLIPTDTEWRKRRLVWGLLQDNGVEKQKEKERKEENVGQQKESTNENAEAQIIEYPQICVICRGKEHTISTCSLLDPSLQHAKQEIAKSRIRTLKEDKAEKLHTGPPDGTLVKDKLSDSNEAKQTIAKIFVRTRRGKRKGKALKLRAERRAENLEKQRIAESRLEESNT